MAATDWPAGTRHLTFTENATNTERLYQPNPQPYVKDAFHRYVVNGEQEAVNPAQESTKAGLLLQQRIAGGGEWVVDLRLARQLQLIPSILPLISCCSSVNGNVSIFDSCAPDSALMTPIFRSAASGLLWCKVLPLDGGACSVVIPTIPHRHRSD